MTHQLAAACAFFEPWTQQPAAQQLERWLHIMNGKEFRYHG